ncbi:hypothetical protein DCCM_2461 [Desulfocucumis palustris]|uniref:Uncharacterized protein n=1 Tax=Desulfocucumis palustris TaxID=1898651 RepID=A0A2L2XB84_9FIRM|nr:hypothetical protein [Desulfocucumis palustris]GBF33360.1 hypothetical protein DCCM_2461 [Desulfocucumis palustris]
MAVNTRKTRISKAELQDVITTEINKYVSPIMERLEHLEQVNKADAGLPLGGAFYILPKSESQEVQLLKSQLPFGGAFYIN